MRGRVSFAHKLVNLGLSLLHFKKNYLKILAMSHALIQISFIRLLVLSSSKEVVQIPFHAVFWIYLNRNTPPPRTHARTHARTHVCTQAHACRHTLTQARTHKSTNMHARAHPHPLPSPSLFICPMDCFTPPPTPPLQVPRPHPPSPSNRRIPSI